MRTKAELIDMLLELRRKLDESECAPVETFQDRTNENYLIQFDKRSQQLKNQLAWMGDIAVLEWVLEEKQQLLTSWMREGKA